MRHPFLKKTWTAYKWCLLLFTLTYWVYIGIDDWVFVARDGLSLAGVGVWFVYYLAYLVEFTVCFALLSGAWLLLRRMAGGKSRL